MAAAPPPQTTTRVYARCVKREIRVLEKKVCNLELELNKELEKISSCSGLLEEIIAQPQDSPCSPLRAELNRVRAKRARAYEKYQRQQLAAMEIGAAPNDPPAGGAAMEIGAAHNDPPAGAAVSND